MERTIQNNRLVDWAKIENLPEDTQGDITSLQSQITNNDSDISSLDSRVTTNEGNIAKKLNDKANWGTYIEWVTASWNITLDKTDPYNPIIWVTPWTGLWDMQTSTYDPANISEQLVWETATQTISNKTLENTSSVWFNTTAWVIVWEWEISWNDEDGTLDVWMKGWNVTGQLFEELFIYAKASEAITNWDVVYKSGVVWGSSKLEVSKYIADGTIDPILVLGIATEDIAMGDFWFVTTFGKIRWLDTSAYTEDTILYASPTTAGAYTSTKPTAPNVIVPIALVTYSHAINWVLSTEKRYLPRIEDLNGIQITSPTTGQSLIYDGTKWVNWTLSASNISNSPNGNISATTVQGAINELDNKKAAVLHTHTSSQITNFSSSVSANTDVSANTLARHTHTNKAILDATTASFTTAYETKLGGIEANANNYSLPTSSTTVLWGVKVDGSTITIDGSGVISSVGGGGSVESFYDVGNSGTSITIDWNNSVNQEVTLTGNCTFTFSNPENGGVYVLKLIQDATWSRTVTLPASVLTQYWALNTSTGASDIDILTLIYDGTNYFANLGKNYE